MVAELVDWRTDREIARLSAEICELHERAEKVAADIVVEMGHRLALARQRLPYGHWLEWVESRLPFKSRAAERWIELAAYARGEPEEFTRLKPLGPGKLFLLIHIEPSWRRRLRPDHTLILHGRKRSIALMNVEELRQALRLAAEPPDDGIPIGKVIRGVRSSVATVRARSDGMIARRSEVERSEAAEIVDELELVAAALIDAFALRR